MRDDALAPRDATARFTGAFLLVAVAYLHLLDISHKVQEGIWYMAFMFATLIFGALVLVTLFVRASQEHVRWVWLGAGLLSLGALSGYFVSRMLPLPGMADHQGDWINLYGVLAGLAEVGLVALSAYAMRDLTLRRVPSRTPSFLSYATTAGFNSLIVLALLPQQALAHGGGHDADAAASGEGADGAGSAAGGGGKGGSAKGSEEGGMEMIPGAHGDPLLGGTELSVAFLASAGFLWWVWRSLTVQVDSAAGLRAPAERWRMQ